MIARAAGNWTVVFIGVTVLCGGPAAAGPPFITDDPEPVEHGHWEVYLASEDFDTADGWSGTAPHVEVNYGAVTNLQLHVILPIAYDAPAGGKLHYGYGDTEVGAKYRFVEETDRMPQVGVFPLLELPTGNPTLGLGTGHLQAYLPAWAQKSFDSWTVYGGGAYDINPGFGNRNWGFAGMVLQCQVLTNTLVGLEIYHRTPTQTGGRSDTAFNLGTVFDFNDCEHLLFSAGRSIDGPTRFQAYMALQWTFGP